MLKSIYRIFIFVTTRTPRTRIISISYLIEKRNRSPYKTGCRRGCTRRRNRLEERGGGDEGSIDRHLACGASIRCGEILMRCARTSASVSGRRKGVFLEDGGGGGRAGGGMTSFMRGEKKKLYKQDERVPGKKSFDNMTKGERKNVLIGKGPLNHKISIFI
ncbi:hypothetical protein CEXT_758661 [Caerostris extrusa]|uniref:Uncharacterized protein n=1 Tax=Caerostris extrusa TaxID=172846 RepID=A0AAV4X3B6_CAEEX|nr:hypothetical protein CEXT_758661 [Caerostris extrusa]